MNNADSLFLSARKIEDTAARKAFLDANCPSHMRKEIEELLAADMQAGEFLATPAHELANPHQPDRVGSSIGPYKLLQRIGRGGFGTVYLAEQSDPVRRKVAVKIINPGMDSRQVIGRFEAERQALAMMDHPHIARVFDGGLTDDLRPFFVMEYVVGDMITAFADAHALTLNDRLTLFSQVCSAVQHAHTKGIIHRDLKPANVLVSMVDGKPFAKVIDFGIAKATGAAGGRLSDKTYFTEHQQLIGTPEYMSPEQAQGSLDIDTRTDVYSLGVILYELLTGSTPIESSRLRSAALDEMKRMIREDEPIAPSMKLSRSLNRLASTAAARKTEPTKLSSLVKGELDWIVLKALEKERGRRYETASALADDVKRHLTGEPVIAAPMSKMYRLRKFVRKNKGTVAAVSAVVLALSAGLSVAAWQWRANRIGKLNAERVREVLELATKRAGDSMMPGLDVQIEGLSLIAPGTAVTATTAFDPVSRDGRPITRDEKLAMWTAEMLVSAADSLKTERDALTRQQKMLTSTLEDFFKPDEASPSRWQVAAAGMLAGIRARDDYQGVPETDRKIWELNLLARVSFSTMIESIDAAEWSAYTANLALAQSALAANDPAATRSSLDKCAPSRRGWEWNWLANHSRIVRHASQHAGYGAVFDSTGERFLLKTDNELKLFTVDGVELWSLPAVNGYLAPRISPRRGLIVTTPTKDSLQLVHLDGTSFRGPMQFSGELRDVLISPDETLMAVSDQANVTFWRLADGERLAIMPRAQDQIEFSPDSTRLLADDRLIDATGKLIVESLSTEGGFLGERWDPRTGRLAVRETQTALRVLEPDGKPAGPALEHPGFVLGLCFFGEDTGLLASVCFTDTNVTRENLVGGFIAPHTVTIWNYTTGERVRQWLFPESRFEPMIRRSEDGQRLVVLGQRNAFIVGADGQVQRDQWLGRQPADARLDTAGRLFLTTELEQTSMYAWDERGVFMGRLDCGQSNVGGIELSPNGLVLLRSWSWVSGYARPLVIDPAALGSERVLRRDYSKNSPDRPLAAILASSPNGPSGLAITTPDGTRRIVGGSDKTVRFYEAKPAQPKAEAAEASSPDAPVAASAPSAAAQAALREVAVFRMPDAVTNLQMTGDGTRLIIHLQDGSARVWDIRDPQERRKDLQAEWAERVPAGAYLDTLWASTTPDDKLRDAIIADASLTPLRRVVAVEMLEERMDELRERLRDRIDKLIMERRYSGQSYGLLFKSSEPLRGRSMLIEMVSPNSRTWPSTPIAVLERSVQAWRASESEVVNGSKASLLATSLFYLGEYQQARTAIEQAIKLDEATPDRIFPISMLYDAMISIKLNDAERAASQLTRARDFISSSPDGSAWRQYATETWRVLALAEHLIEGHVRVATREKLTELVDANDFEILGDELILLSAMPRLKP